MAISIRNFPPNKISFQKIKSANPELMNNASFRLKEPSSPEAVEKVWDAYNRISDREKKKLLKVLHKKDGEGFKWGNFSFR